MRRRKRQNLVAWRFALHPPLQGKRDRAVFQTFDIDLRHFAVAPCRERQRLEARPIRFGFEKSIGEFDDLIGAIVIERLPISRALQAVDLPRCGKKRAAQIAGERRFEGADKTADRLRWRGALYVLHDE